jgi:hypothetical protein
VTVCEGVAGVEFFEPLVYNSPEYQRVHRHVRETYGDAIEYGCIQCGEQAVEWAWQHGEDPNLITSYEPMCFKCHDLYDGPQVGVKHSQARLTEEDVREIRNLWPRFTQKDIAYIYGMSVTHVNSIINRKKWRHV